MTGKLKGSPQQLAHLEMSQHLQTLGSLPPYRLRNPRKGTHSFGQLGSCLPSRRWGKGWVLGKRTKSASWDRPSHGCPGNPTVVKVTGIIPWIHLTRVKKAATSCDEDSWKTVQDPRNPVKVWFQKQEPSLTKEAEPCCRRSRNWLVHAWQTLEDSSALLQPHCGSSLVKAQQKLEDLAIQILMDFYCQPWPLSLIGITAVLFTTGLASVTAQV